MCKEHLPCASRAECPDEKKKGESMNPHYEALAREFPQWTLGRVVSQEKALYRVACEGGENLAEVSGRFRYETVQLSDYPAVGDYVMLHTAEDGGNAVIHRVLDRKSLFVRRAAGTARQEQVVAANIDIMFLCMSLNNDFNLRRMERYLSIAWDSGATPVILLTKADLCDCVGQQKAEVEGIAAGVDILVTSSFVEDGIAAVLPYLRSGVTASFIGSSGVGKSTLINRLAGSDRLATGGLRNDDKGRHTTTHRELITLSSGAMVIDTPGMRELGMWGTETGIDTVFADIEVLSAQCHFSNCTHTAEPGCAIKAALSRGELTEERFASYKKLIAEKAYAEDARSFLAGKREKFKTIARINRARSKK